MRSGPPLAQGRSRTAVVRRRSRNDKMGAMVNVRELLHMHHLDRIATEIEAAALPTVFLAPGQPSESAVSRMGGRPNLNPDVQWPEWRGRPLAFIAQIDLSRVPSASSLKLPDSGALYFFYEGGLGAWGYDPGDRGCAQVIYESRGLFEPAVRPFPESLTAELRFQGVRLEPSGVELSLPDCTDPILAPLQLTQEECDSYFECLAAWRNLMPPTFHRLGGHPEALQDEPKYYPYAASLGMQVSSSLFEGAEEPDVHRGAAEWELLLQLGPDESAGMHWGDEGAVYFLIRRADRAQWRFDSVWLVLQSC